MLLLGVRVQAICPKSAGLVFALGSFVKPSALLFLRWVEPTGPILIRLEPNCIPEFPLGDNWASGIPLQPMTLWIWLSLWQKENSSEKNYSEILILDIPCICSVRFSSSAWQLPSQASSGAFPKTVSLPLLLTNWRGDGTVPWLLSKCSEKG